VVADRATVESIHRRKTAALIAAAVDAGAVAGGADGDRRPPSPSMDVRSAWRSRSPTTSSTRRRRRSPANASAATPSTAGDFPGVLGLDGARAAARDLLARCRARRRARPPGEPLRAIASFVVERAC
jgi:hypothetical protein